MLVNMNEILSIAKERNFAVPAFNAGSGQLLGAVMEASEAQNAPLIMAIHPDELSFLRDSFVAQVIAEAHTSKIPICLHLDHGSSIEQILHAVQLGFTSVMIDGSHLPFEENIALSKRVVDLVKPLGVSVEGELGTIGTTGNSAEGGADEIVYTVPSDAKTFVEKTGVDTLAIAIGTAHGIYPKGFVPKLKLDLLQEIQAAVDVPLVLHGGSNNADDEIGKAAQSGISKINISSDIKVAFADACKIFLNDHIAWEPNVIFVTGMEACKQVAVEKMELFGCVGQAKHYKLSE